MAFGSSHLLFIFMIVFTTFNLISIPSHSLPFVVFHGIADQCSNDGVSTFTELLSNWSGSQGYCIEIGNGERDSWFMPFMDQTSIACEKVKQMSELKDGYTIIGLSQGNMVGRGVLEFCDDGPLVKNFISLAGPHAGEASIPFCGVSDSLLTVSSYLDVLTNWRGLCFTCACLNMVFVHVRCRSPSTRFSGRDSGPGSANFGLQLRGKDGLGLNLRLDTLQLLFIDLKQQPAASPSGTDDLAHIQNMLRPYHKQHPPQSFTYIGIIRGRHKIRNRGLVKNNIPQAQVRSLQLPFCRPSLQCLPSQLLNNIP
ncbi:protein modifying enzyme [Lithospermum erythrorhizon]|uniref:Protein modifying enzyme n=1 Tax=Lithospermum erythrorhizon TaxID=34254 RepID=A0AAV3QIF8_LITER